METCPFILDLPIRHGEIPEFCVSLPEGKSHKIPVHHHFPMVFLWFSHFPMVFLWFSHGFMGAFVDLRGFPRPLDPADPATDQTHGAEQRAARVGEVVDDQHLPVTVKHRWIEWHTYVMGICIYIYCIYVYI